MKHTLPAAALFLIASMGFASALPGGHGFERIGSELSLSPSHVKRYYRAAGLVLDRAFPAENPETRKVRKTAADLRYGGGKSQMEVLARFGIKRPLRYLLVPRMSYADGGKGEALSPDWLGKTGPEHSGDQTMIAAADNTLKFSSAAYTPAQNAMRGPILEVKKSEGEPPLGSSGIQIRVETQLIIEGGRPGRVVRIWAQGWSVGF